LFGLRGAVERLHFFFVYKSGATRQQIVQSFRRIEIKKASDSFGNALEHSTESLLTQKKNYSTVVKNVSRGDGFRMQS